MTVFFGFPIECFKPIRQLKLKPKIKSKLLVQ